MDLYSTKERETHAWMNRTAPGETNRPNRVGEDDECMVAVHGDQGLATSGDSNREFGAGGAAGKRTS